MMKDPAIDTRDQNNRQPSTDENHIDQHNDQFHSARGHKDEENESLDGPFESEEEGFTTDDTELDDDEDQDASDSGSDLRGLVGLQNLGNTCYMNGALQALSNCQQLTRFLLDCPRFLKERGLCRSYSELIKEIWDSKTSQYAVPTSIIRNIKCIYPAFRGCTQQDTQEFLRCFLEQLHDELKQPLVRRQIKTANTPSDKGDINSDISQRSIVSDTFEFKISSSVVCSCCNNISTTQETFKDLSIPIPSRDHPYYQTPVNHLDSHQEECPSILTTQRTGSESPTIQRASCSNHVDSRHETDSESGSKLKPFSFPLTLSKWFWEWLSYFGGWIWGPQVTLTSCLSIFFGTDPLEGDNEYSCDVCTRKNRGVKYLKILDLPEVLCIHFKRYESVGSAKITTHVSFPLVGLDLAPFMADDSKPQCTTYNLIACICHHGSALLTGHYTTYALNCYDDQWYEFDDQYVTSVQDYQVKNSEAYILFYQKSMPGDQTTKKRVKASRLWKKSLCETNLRPYFISKQWVNKFNTFVDPGPITNSDFLCEHQKVPRNLDLFVNEMCHPISETVWRYLQKLHGGGPECQELVTCTVCE